ncbi:hypothetical protein PENSPDRAFT_747578 [Peniophora sp. CONT]|nr:hypothetical protein PENSPDRAFT_747578 [Peniophora sp. CONT]
MAGGIEPFSAVIKPCFGLYRVLISTIMSSLVRLVASDGSLKSVTIFQSDRAEVTRHFSVALQTGQNDVEIAGLSSYIDVDSVRVAGLGDARLFEVSCKVQKRATHRTSGASETSDSERIRILNDKKAVLTQEKNVCESAATLLRDYGKTLSGEHVAPADADSFLDNYLSRGTALARTAAKLDDEILQVTREIEDITTAGSLKKGETDGKVNIAIMAKTQTEVLLKLIYVVRRVSWKPSYELHARVDESGMPAPSVWLQYRATIMQTTGEDWRGVTLTLSTAIPSLANESVPELKPTRIIPLGSAKPHPGPKKKAPRGASFLGGVALSTSASRGEIEPQSEHRVFLTEEDEAGVVEPPPAFEQVTSIAKESHLFVSYKIDGESSIPSDGEDHTVSIAELPFETTISHVVVPKVKAVVYLEAKVRNTSDYRLMPGPVNVFFDNSLVSKTSVKDIGPGGEFTCALGPDMSTRITYKRTSKLEKDKASRFSEQYATTTYTALTTINNTHPFALTKLVVRDGLPTSDDGNRVRVILREPSALVEMEQGEQKEVGEHKITWCSPSGQKDGLYEWQCALGAGQEIALSTSWDIKAPADVKWIESSP